LILPPKVFSRSLFESFKNMKIKTNRIQTAIKLASLCLIASPLAQGVVLIGDGIHGGELEPTTSSNWDPGVVPGGNPDQLEFHPNEYSLIATAGGNWIDSAGSLITQNIINTNLFDIAPDTTVTFEIDFSVWSFGLSSRPEAIVNFYLGATLLGTVTTGMDTNGSTAWNTFTATNLPVAAGAGQQFRMNTVTAPGAPVTPLNTLGIALDNVRLSTVPEPSTSLLGVVALGLALGRRRRL
jgi:MYXO-CTERM domain-containing protein